MSLKKRTVTVSLSNLFNTLSNLVLSVGLAWIIIDKEEFGKIQQILMIASFSYSIVSGFPMGLSYFYGKYISYTSRINLFKKVFLSLTFVCLLLCLLVYCFKSFFSDSFKNPEINSNIFEFVVILFLKCVGAYFINFFVLIKKENKLLLVNSIFFILNILLILFIILFPIYSSLSSILFLLIILEAFRLTYYLSFIRKYLVSGNEYLINKMEFNYIISVTGVTILNTFYVFIDKYMISFMLTPKDYANYQVGAFVVPFIGIITGSIMTTLTPILSSLKRENKLDEISIKLKQATRFASIILIPIFTFCLVFGKELIISIYSDRYFFSGEIFQIYSLRYFTAVILFSLTMASIGLQNWVLVSSFISLILNIALNYIFILNYGVMGAVYATVITGYLGILVPIYIINKNLKCEFLDYFPLKEYLIVLLSSFLIAYPVYYLFYINWNVPSLLVFPLSIVFYIVVLSIVNKFFKFFDYSVIFQNIKFFFNERRK